MDHRATLGAAGEVAARRHLQRRGWEILATNLRGGAEIDLIAHRDGVLVGCEVKSVRRSRGPYPAVSHRQRERLMRAMDAFARRRPHLARRQLRLDLMLVRPTLLGWRVRQLAGALDDAVAGSNSWRGGYATDRNDLR
jgi:putative endonuclease